MRRTVLSVMLAMTLGCGDDAAEGMEDGGRSDAAARDLGTEDGGGAETDAGGDGGETDPDLGESPGEPDSGVPDLGLDMGPVEDPSYMASAHHVTRPLGTTDAAVGYWEYLPPNYSESGAPAPLLLFFHGLGENGDGSDGDLQGVLGAGPPRFIDRDEWTNTRPFVVLSMQNASGCPSANEIRDFLDYARTAYNVDPDRLYLTGLSCGAIGIANYLRVHIDESPVAAVVGISGNWNTAWNDRGCELGQVPIWAIHGDSDGNSGTPPGSTENPITMLMACPQPPREDVRLNMLEGVGHNGRAWNDTYDLTHGLQIYDWMLSHRR